MAELDAETKTKLSTTSTATLTTQLYRRGFRNAFLQGPRPLGRYGSNMVGPAFTLRYVPAREDLDSHDAKQDPNATQREAIEAVPPGHVLVMDCRGNSRAASAGDVYVTRLKVRGVAGLVSDGGIRDSGPIAGMDFPVFCARPSAPTNRIVHHAADYNLPVGCGEVAIYPGDIMVGDADGVIAIPRHIVEEVARDAAQQEELEAYILHRVASGEKLPGLYPVNARTREEYAAWVAQKRKSDSA
ncbi:MAG TPA: ribonuclease activity regulator RraA [Steroidobacteraceae bacterium]|jgi:regulator of RNase E activity RraA|nr:ribonuclease activity regulator RraA [Steroidobacteraceae bacterium]